MARGSIALALLIAVAPALRGQGDSPRLRLDLPDPVIAGASAPTTVISGILTEGHRQQLLNEGWPTVIRARVELWKKGGWLGMFSREADFTWDVVVEYSPAAKTYHLRRVVNNRVENLGETSTIDGAEQLLRRPYAPPLSPRRQGDRYFYLFNIEISSLSLTDLEAWQRWVKGEAAPAIQGKRNPVGAFQQGVGSLLSRVLGGDTQSYEMRSGVFRAG